MDGIFVSGLPVLLDPSHEVETLVRNRLASFVWPGTDAGTQSPSFPGSRFESAFALPYPAPPEPRLNEWIDPTGVSRFGRGLFLIGTSAMQTVAEDAFGYAGTLGPPEPNQPDAWGQVTGNPVTLKFAFGSSQTSRSVYPLATFSIESHTGYRLWLVPFVDVRYRWLRTLVQITPADCATWSTLFAKLSAAAGQTITAADIATDYGVPDVEAFSGNLSLAVAVDAAALSIGRRATVKPDGSIAIQTASQANTAADASIDSLPLKIGGKSPDVQLPASVEMSGPIASDYFDGGDTWKDTASVSNGVSDANPVSAFTSFYLHRVSGSVVNQAAIDAFLAQVGSDVAAWRPRGGLVVSPSFRTIQPSTAWDYVSFHVNGVDSIHTSAVMMPTDFVPRFWFNQWSNTYVHSQNTASFEPRGGQSVRFAIRSSNYAGIPGTVNVAGFNGSSGDPLLTGHYQTGRGWLPIASNTTSTTTPTNQVNFVLTSDMSGGQASATINGEAKTVVDLAGVYPDLMTGCHGRAVAIDDDTFQIVHSTRPAARYIAYLADDLASSESQAKVDVSAFGITSPEPFVNPYSFTITTGSSGIPDYATITNLLANNGRKGDRVIIARSLAATGVPNDADWYVEDISNSQATRIRGTAESNFDFDENITIENIIGLDGDWPAGTLTQLVTNQHEWEGVTGDKIRAEWNQTNKQWEAYQKDC